MTGGLRSNDDLCLFPDLQPLVHPLRYSSEQVIGLQHKVLGGGGAVHVVGEGALADSVCWVVCYPPPPLPLRKVRPCPRRTPCVNDTFWPGHFTFYSEMDGTLVQGTPPMQMTLFGMK